MKWLDDLAATLDSLLSVRYQAPEDQPRRTALIVGYIANELRRLNPRLAPLARLEDLRGPLAALSETERSAVRNRCLFYACDELILLLTHKQLRGDAVVREEAVLYVQDHLQRDDFRRIAAFDADKGATFRTYLWRVIANLLLDFARIVKRGEDRRGRRAASEAEAGLVADDDAAEADVALSEEQLRAAVRAIVGEQEASLDASRALHERLRRHVRLTSTERLFLRALFQYDMSVEEVRQLPGFAMEKNEAYRFYYRIIEQLLESFKEAGVLAAMRGLVSDAPSQVTVAIGGERLTLDIIRLYYFQLRADESVGCHAEVKGTPTPGRIEESFAKLRKRLAPWFSAVNPTTLVRDELLAADGELRGQSEPAEFRIRGIEQAFAFGRSQLAALRRRFAAKPADDTRI